MAVLPVFILLLGALVIWVMRKGSARLGWSIGAASAALAWFSSLIISRSLPMHTSLSVWQPTDLFAAQLEFALDSASSRVVIAGATAVFSVVLSNAVKLTDKEFRFRPIVLIYGGVALLAVLSANLLTVTVSWALVDIVTFLNGMVQGKESSVTSGQINRLVLNFSGLFAVIGAAIVNRVAGGTDDFATPFHGYWATAILLLAVMMRIDIFRFGSVTEGNPDEDEAFQTLAGVLPHSAALIIIARQFAFGLPEELIGWIRVICAFGLLISGIRWVIAGNGEDRQRFFNIGIALLGVFISSAVPTRPEAPIISAIGAMIVLGTLFKTLRIHSPWQRIFPVLAALILVMPGWTIGAFLIQGIATGLEVGSTLWIALIGSLGLALLVAGLIRDVFKDAQIWYVDDLARLFYTLALFLPTIIGFGLGGGSGSSIDIRAVIATLITTGATAGILVVMRRMESKTLQGIRGTIARGPGETLANASRGILNWASKSLRLIGGILEGEGAMLWVFVVLMMVQLAIGGGSR